MLRVTAVIEKRFICFLAVENGDEDIVPVMLSEVTTHTALPVMNCLHRDLRVQQV